MLRLPAARVQPLAQAVEGRCAPDEEPAGLVLDKAAKFLLPLPEPGLRDAVAAVFIAEEVVGPHVLPEAQHLSIGQGVELLAVVEVENAHPVLFKDIARGGQRTARGLELIGDFVGCAVGGGVGGGHEPAAVADDHKAPDAAVSVDDGGHDQHGAQDAARGAVAGAEEVVLHVRQGDQGLAVMPHFDFKALHRVPPSPAVSNIYPLYKRHCITSARKAQGGSPPPLSRKILPQKLRAVFVYLAKKAQEKSVAVDRSVHGGVSYTCIKGLFTLAFPAGWAALMI